MRNLRSTAFFSRLANVRNWLARHPEPIIYWLLAIAHLAPVWYFTYLPTQDGPSHVNNAQIIKDFADPTTHYDDFFELRYEPLPNLTSHLLLVALLYVFPPLIAEKVLVSIYVLGFAWSYRFFLSAFGPRCLPLSWIGLALVYNRCLWMGFYNQCLGLILLWGILGLALRWRGRLGLLQTFVLASLFTVAYFTHLVAFILAVVGALGTTLLTQPRRILAPILVLVAVLPAACLTINYLHETGFFQADSARRIVHDPLARLRGEDVRTTFVQDLTAIDDELFAHHVGTEVPGTLVLAFHLILLALFTAVEFRAESAETADATGRLFPAVFGFLLIVMYFLTANDLSEHGGFLKTRLAPLFVLVWLACLRESTHIEVRLFLRGLTIVLLALNLLLVIAGFAEGNRQIAEYMAGLDAVGTEQRIFVIQPDPRPRPIANPLTHAADYYCLGTGNVNLDNYEAETLHFPVKYRSGVRRGRTYWNAYPHKDAVDVIVSWQPDDRAAPRMPAGWEIDFQQGPLRIYRRSAKN